MFRNMRRKNQQLPEAACIEILQKGTSGVLALAGEDGDPYAVPLSYVYQAGKIFFHCAPEGHKLELIAQNDKGSFCVIGQDIVVPERFTTHYKSVIVFGRLRQLTGAEKRAAIGLLAEKYTPGDAAGRKREIEKTFARLCMLELCIERMTGKQARELVHENMG